MLNKKLFIILIFSTATFVRCVSLEEPAKPAVLVSHNPAAERLFKEAVALFEDDNWEMSEKALKSFAKDFPDDPLINDVTIYISRILSLRNDHQAALDLLCHMDNKIEDSPTSRMASFYEGVFLFRLGRSAEALKKLQPYVGHMTVEKENMLLLDTLWRSARAVHDMYAQVTWMNRYIGADPSSGDIGMALQELASLVKSLDKEDLLNQLAETLNKEGAAWPLVMARIAVLKINSGKLNTAAEILARAQALGRGDVPAIMMASEILESGQLVDLNAIACILPLSGRSRLVGEEILKGVMLGAKMVKLGDDRESLSVVIRDSAKSKETAVSAVREMVGKEHVAGIVGPVDGSVSKVAALAAAKLGVPTLLLTSKEGIAKVGNSIFRRFPSGRGEISALIDAAKRLGSSTYAVLFSDDGYGRSMKRSFLSELSKQNIKPTFSLSFDPAKKDYVAEASLLSAEKFDVLFVAARSSQIALIAPALASEGLWSTIHGEQPQNDTRAIQLIIPSAGISNDLQRRAGRYLQGAIFASNFFKDSSVASVDFADRYQEQYGKLPTYYAAFGYDAVLLFAGALTAGAVNRDQIIQWMTSFDRTKLPFKLITSHGRGFSETGESFDKPWTIMLRGETWELLR